MFIRVKTNPNSPRKSVQIVESKRVANKVKQTIVKHVGVANNEKELEELKLFANSLKNKLEQDGKLPLYTPEELDNMTSNKTTDNKNLSSTSTNKMLNRDDYDVNLLDLIEEDRVINGISDIYGKLYDDMNFKTILSTSKRHDTLSKTLKEIVLARVANPDSKKSTVDMLALKFGVQLNLKTVYKMMDFINDNKIKKLNQLVLNQTANLLNNTIDILYFDATTLYFESFSEDEFKKNGYSKDKKFNQPQIVLALLVTKNGLPVGYKAFSGDTFDGHTIIPAIESIKDELKDMQLDKVVYVADSGMFNRVNLEKLEEYKIDYIVGARIKNLSNRVKEEILDIESYEYFDDDKKIKTIEYEGRKLVVTYSLKRANKDKQDRLKAIDKLQKKLKSSNSVKSQLSNQGYKKYIKLESNSDKKECDLSIELNEEKIKDDELWDGLKGIITNNRTLSNEELIHQYSNLWQIEESFRITKHDLKIRPIYHWKPSRVKAHLAISFMAYTLVRHLEYRVKLLYKKLSPQMIRQMLLSVQTSIFYDSKNNKRFAMPSLMDSDVKKIYKIMDVPIRQTVRIV